MQVTCTRRGSDRELYDFGEWPMLPEDWEGLLAASRTATCPSPQVASTRSGIRSARASSTSTASASTCTRFHARRSSGAESRAASTLT